MKITVLDTDTVSYGDVDFSPISELGEVSYYKKLSPTDTISACREAEAVLINKAEMSKEVISALPKLRYIGTFATGYNNVDIGYCRERGIVVSNAPSYSTHAVAQHAISLMLMSAGNTHLYAKSVADGDWILSDTFSYYAFPQAEVYGKVFGVLGFGEIGRATAAIASALGMKVIVYSRRNVGCPYEFVTLERLFSESDYLSLHCPLTEETRRIVNSETLSLMKSGATLINTARGGLIDEAALAAALNEGRLYRACLDVLDHEPMLSENPLKGAKNCIITPHVAWAAVETRRRLVKIVADNLSAFIDGKPVNVVS